MLNNWMCSAFEYVYLECGQDGLSRVSKQIKRVFGRIKTIRTKKACQIYNAKTAQLFHLTKHLPAKDLLVVECDQLILEKKWILPKSYSSLDLEFRNCYWNWFDSRGIDKARVLSGAQRRIIEDSCVKHYAKAREYLSYTRPNNSTVSE